VDRDRYIAAHGQLRELLAAALSVPARELRFTAGEHGKPRLAGEADVEFNLSHAGSVGLFGSMALPIGVDVEVWRPLSDRDSLARRYFSPAEFASYAATPEEGRTAAFFACWTRKEAIVKVDGRGLALGLSSFDVEIAPAATGSLLQRPPPGCPPLVLLSLEVGPDTSAAVAVACDFCGVERIGPHF
jgi:4'-phosphopantetheinyl transferase